MMAEAEEDPRGIVKEPGFADNPKPGWGPDTTVKLTRTEWDRLPLVPVTVTL